VLVKHPYSNAVAVKLDLLTLLTKFSAEIDGQKSKRKSKRDRSIFGGGIGSDKRKVEGLLLD